jgi:hypothetical protein
VALAALAPLGNTDYESVELSPNPNFIEMLERCRASYREKGGISAEEMKKRLAT